MKIAINYTMEDGFDRTGLTLKHYMGNDFWVEFDFFSCDLKGEIWNWKYEPIISPYSTSCEWIGRGGDSVDCDDECCVGDIFGYTYEDELEYSECEESVREVK